MTRSGLCCRRKTSSSPTRSSSMRRARSRRSRCARARATAARPAPPPWARPLPDVTVDRGATEPLAKLRRHLETTPHRVLLVADSEGRRESLLDMLRDHGIEPPSVATLAEFEAGDEKVAITAAPLGEGFFWFEPEAAGGAHAIQFITENELFASGATPRRRRRGQEQTSSVDALIKDLSELKIGDPVVHASHGIGRYRGLLNIDLGEGPSEFLHLEYADKATLYVPVAQLALISRYTGVSAEEAPLHKLGSGQWDKARRKAAEQVRDAAPPSQAEPVRAPCGARRLLAPLLAARLRGLRGELRLRGDPRPARRHPRRDPGHGQPQADGSPRVRRCRLRQDRGGPARRVRGRARGQAGRAARAHDAAGRAALPDPRRSLRPVAGEGGRDVALSHDQGDQRRAGRPRGRHDRHRRRHAQAALAGGEVQAPGAAGHRRGAPLRRAPQGGREGDARRGRRAHAHRHADPAHAGHGARGPARSLGDRHRAAAPARDQDLRAQREPRHDPRGGAARAQARRPGLLPAQRGRDHTGSPAREARRACWRRRASRSRTADVRARVRQRDARLRRPARERAAVLHHHRDRHRRAHGQHHRHQPRRQVRPRAAASTAGPRGPFAPPCLCLPARARRRSPDQAGRAAPGRDPADGGTGLGLLPRDARPRDPRRGRGAGREPEQATCRRSASSFTTTCCPRPCAR